jgi:hypothetical protein
MKTSGLVVTVCIGGETTKRLERLDHNAVSEESCCCGERNSGDLLATGRPRPALLFFTESTVIPVIALDESWIDAVRAAQLGLMKRLPVWKPNRRLYLQGRRD